MGILSAFRKSSGGFLNNVDGVIVDYGFTTEPDFGGEARQQTERADKSTPLWVKLTVRQDGAEANESTHLDAGAADDFVISEDGHTLEPVGDGKLWGNTSFMKLIASLVENGLAEPEWEPGQPITFEGIIGTRVRFVQVKDDERQNRSAAAFKANKGKTRTYYNAEGQKKGKDGKFYDQRTLQVSQVYGSVDISTLGTSKPANASGAAAKTAAKSAKPAANGKKVAAAKAAVAADSGSDLKEVAGEVLNTILSNAKDNKVSKSKMNYEVTKLFATAPYRDKGPDVRDGVRKYLYEDANLEALQTDGVITFDKSSKDQTISLA